MKCSRCSANNSKCFYKTERLCKNCFVKIKYPGKSIAKRYSRANDPRYIAGIKMY